MDLVVDEKVLRPILTSLYYPESPYEFSVIPVEILGNVYEQFLGKVIRLTAGHHAKVEEKPEVKKAGGVYYTPAYIVNYIVDHTVGELCAGKNPKQLESLRILDPACGSGSFLLGAYQRLLEYHLRWYSEHEPKNHRQGVFESPDGWCLTTAVKRRILLNNIYGVDIDHQAVEVTKLSLLLKLLEGENAETLRQHRLFGERALPSLERNIQCGNSLIGPDAFRGELFPDPQELARIKPFDWQKAFPQVMKVGGFDAAIGNPPYLKIEHTAEFDRQLLAAKFRSLKRRFDAYGLFLELAVRLVRPAGRLGFIVPSTLLNNLSFGELRRLLLDETSVDQLVNLGGRVFKGANNDTLIVLARRGARPGNLTQIFEVPNYGDRLSEIARTGAVELRELAAPPDFTFQLRTGAADAALFAKLQSSSVRLGSLFESFQGFVTGGNEAYIVSEQAIRSERLERVVCKPAVFGDGIARYQSPRSESFVIYLTRTSSLRGLPHVEAHLAPFKRQLEKKREVVNGRQPWFALHWPRSAAKFERPEKILVQAIRNLALPRRVVATLDRRRLYADHTLNILIPQQESQDLRPLLAVLNSSLVNYLFSKRHIDINIKGVYLEAIPLPMGFLGSPAHARLVELAGLVEEMVELADAVSAARTAHDREGGSWRLEAMDREIDQLVYDLYGLTKEEIRLVEEAAARAKAS